MKKGTNKMKAQTLINIIITLLTILFIMIITMPLYFCSAPTKSDFEYSSCYQALLCIYYCKQDKSICQNLINACTDDLQYNKKISAIEYCNSSKRPQFLSDRECFLYLTK